MESSNGQPGLNYMVQVDWADRWQVYQRLQDLAIPCRCTTNQPLIVDIANVTAAVQLWSVWRQFNTSRQELMWWLESCWQQ